MDIERINQEEENIISSDLSSLKYHWDNYKTRHRALIEHLRKFPKIPEFGLTSDAEISELFIIQLENWHKALIDKYLNALLKA